MVKRLHVNLRGGLGNQLHIFIAAWVLGKSLGKSLQLDGRFISWTGSNPNRRIEIDQFLLPSTNEKNNKYLASFPSLKRLPIFRLAILKLADIISHQFEEMKFPVDSWSNFDHILDFVEETGVVNGYFLDLRWMLRAYDLGFPEFLVLPNVSEDVSIFESFNAKQCAIHVRLTDYLTQSSSFVHLSEKYYLSAIMEFREKGYEEFLIFTDDVEALIIRFPHLVKVENITIIPSHLSSVDSFYLMHKCSAIISANSTFSTLAAMFIWRRGGHVIAPNARTVSADSDEYWVPSEWLILDSLSGTKIK